ncbi:MAG: response regulator transcription factor [Gammaproteobacteria bacterium]|uniref:response regulator transcription factor n=1 Tax=Pseudomaricurvus alcaniphilus TaxID=1166482 RepID=UPI001409366B|nr:response regulator transcription factor [Pseudomaricurvus alcaniphilus]MBR9910465.1 response regulator transcription factor [Gammaproteobacteria bacterium]NHN39736.1 response regulator transcription factor [Pseudomaricurvus alcaniphilus]
MANNPCIIIADDHPLFRSALCGTLQRELNEPQLIEAADFNSLQTAVEAHKTANLILLDLHMPGAEGFSALVFLTAHYAHIPVMVVSAMEEPDIIRRAMDHGACGFLPKSASIEDMTAALTAALAGNLWLPAGIDDTPAANEAELNIAESLARLTPQQFRVAAMVNQGLLNKQIAYELNVTEATIKAHMTEIFRKLGVHSRTQAVLAMAQLAINPNSTLEAFRSQALPLQ